MLKFNRIDISKIDESLGSPLNDYISEIISLYNNINDKLITGKYKVVPEDVINVPGTNYKAELHHLKINLNDISLNKIFYSKRQFLILDVYNIKTSENNINHLNRIIINNSKGLTISNSLDKISRRKIKNKYINDRIQIQCFSINGKLVPISFFILFYHEFNHFFRNYSELHKTNTNLNYINKINVYEKIYNNLINNTFDELSNKLCNIIAELFYYLLNDDELNAFSTQYIAEYISKRIINDKSSYYEVNELIEDLELYIDVFDRYIDCSSLYKVLQNTVTKSEYKLIGIDIDKSSEYIKNLLIQKFNKQLIRLKMRIRKSKDRLSEIDDKFNNVKTLGI